MLAFAAFSTDLIFGNLLGVKYPDSLTMKTISIKLPNRVLLLTGSPKQLQGVIAQKTPNGNLKLKLNP
jgi:hypothetical protein